MNEASHADDRLRGIPCQIVAGPLGVGKTTAILDFLRRNAGRGRIAVLVNDFGEAGIDGRIFAGASEVPPVEVVAVPGGCLCCTSPVYFEEALLRLAALEPRPDRILIEPSGVVMLGPLKRHLRRLCESHPLELQPTVVLIPPARLGERHLCIPFYGQLVEEADILVANQTDRATSEQLVHFSDWTSRIQPPKLLIAMTRNGILPEEVFTTTASSAPVLSDAESGDAASSAGHSGLRSGLWEAAATRLVDLDRLSEFLQGLRIRLEPGGLGRLKGIVHTDCGWRLVQWTGGTFTVHPFAAQDRSRVEWIWEGEGDFTHIAQGLEGCVLG